MGKNNPKAGATQLSQDIAAQQAAEEQQKQAAAETTSSASSQENAGAQDAPAQPAATQEQPPQEPQQQEAAPAPAPAEQDLIIQPVAPTPPAPAEQPKVVVAEASKPVAANASLTEQLAAILKDVPAAYQTDISRILAYLERMAPNRPVDVKVGVTEQVALYKSIQNIINRQDEYFTQLFSAVLFIFKNEAKGAMSDRYRMRFMDNITLGAGDRKAFANITQMLAILADPKSRDLAMKQINMERALENGLTAEGRTRVLNYFNI